MGRAPEPAGFVGFRCTEIRGSKCPCLSWLVGGREPPERTFRGSIRGCAAIRGSTSLWIDRGAKNF